MNSFVPVTVLRVGLAAALVGSGWGGAEARVRSGASGSGVFMGTNIYGRTGLLFADTAQVPKQGHGSIVGTLLYGTGDRVDFIGVPFGGNYGIAENMELSAGLEFLSLDVDLPPAAVAAGADDSASGLGNLTVGGKYLIPARDASMPDIAVGLDISHGPLSEDLGDDGTDINLKGMATHKVRNDLMVNGGLGLLVEDDRGGVDGDTVLQLNGGLAYALKPDLSGIAELSINGQGEDDGVLAVGVRGATRGAAKFHALLGFGIGSDAADFTLGGGVQLPY